MKSTMHHIEFAYILAGGRSSRFGKNKALVEIDGVPLVQKLSRELEISGLKVTLVAQSDQDYSSLGIPTIRDGTANAGPMAGVIAALEHAASAEKKWCLILSCDLLEWRSEWFTAFQAGLSKTTEAAIVILEGQPFRPFPGLYRTDGLDKARQTLAMGDGSLRGFYKAISNPICKCPIPKGANPMEFNTPEELDRHKEARVIRTRNP
jgi:molybdenum cofactor guanylyltransferase